MAIDNNDISLSMGLDKDALNKLTNDIVSSISAAVAKANSSINSTTTTGQKSSDFFKSWSFNIGLVGYSLENLGRRLTQFSTELLSFLENSAKVTENLERMRNSLTVEGVSASDKNSIEAQIRRISDLPNGKIDTITKGFVELHKAGLDANQTIDLLEGLTKGTAAAGSGETGLVHSITILRDTLSANKFARGLRSLEGSLGPEVVKSLESVLGATDAKDLNKIGVKQVVSVISQSLSEVKDSLPITLDRLERVQNRFALIRANLERILAPSLDRMLKTMDSLVDLSDRLATKFENLSDPQKNFISNMLVAIPAVAAGLGIIASTLGVVGIAVLTIGRALPVIKGIWAAFVGFGGEIKNLLGPIGITFKLWSAGVFSFSEVVATLTGELGGLFGGLTKVLGLTSPIGLLLNLILAYATNAGRARDLINGAIGNIYDSVVKLFSKLDEFFSTTGTGGSIVSFITAITNLLGGVLGDVLSAALQSISKLIDSITDLFEFFRNPTVESFKKFADDFSDAVAGAFVNLGKLLAASFIDAIAELGKSKPTISASTLAGPLALPQLAASSIVQGFGGFDKLKDAAERLRSSTGIISKDTDQTADNLARAKAEALLLQTNLDNSSKIINQMNLSLEKARASFAKVFADIDLANTKFKNAQTERESQERIDQLIKAVGTGAIPDIQAAQKTNTAQGVSEVRQEIRSELPALASVLRQAGIEMDRAIESATQVQTNIQNLTNFRAQLGNLINLSQSPNVSLSSFQAQFNKVDAAQRANTFNALGTEGKTQLTDIEQAWTKVLEATTNVDKKLGEQIQKENEIKHLNEEKAQAEEKAARAQQRRADAQVAARGIELQLAELDKKHQQDSTAPQNTPEQIKLAQDRELEYSNKKLELEAKKREILKDNIDLVDKEKDKTKDATDKIIAGAKVQIDIIDIRTKANEAFIQSFIAGFSALDTFRQKLEAVNKTRASLGLSSNQPTSAFGANGLLDFQTRPLTTRNRELGGDANTASQLERMVESLQRGAPLSKTFADNLLKIGVSSQTGLAALEGSITTNAGDILRQRAAVGRASTPADKDAEQKKLEDLLKIQTQLGVQAEIYSNNLSLVNTILAANDKQLAKNLEDTLNQNIADRANLQFQIDKLELQKQLADLQESNRQKQAQVGGIQYLLDTKTINKEIEDSINRQIQLTEAKFALQVKELELQKIQAQAEVDAGLRDQQEADIKIQQLNTQIDLINTIKRGQVKGLELDKTIKEVATLKDNLQNLGQVALNKVSDDFVRLIGHIKDSHGDLIKTKDIFKDLAQAGIASFGEALAQALVSSIANGENFLKSLGHIFGQVLIQLGTMLISLGAGALAMSVLGWAFPILKPLLDPSSAGTGAAIAAIAIGTGLVAAGALMGGGNAKAPATSNTNASNKANSTAGATGPTFDPFKDPKTIYQKAMMAQILIDIKTDSGQIVKTIVKEVNGNGRLSTLIGNRKLGFG